MKILDFRVRAPYGGFLQSGFYQDIPFREQVAAGKYNMHLPQSVRDGSMVKLLEEMDALNIVQSVVPARKLFDIDNADMERLTEEYPGRFITFAAVDPANPQEALAEIERYVIHGKCTAVVLEPGFSKVKNLACDDETIYPIYAICQQHDIPIMLGYGGMLHASLKIFQPVQLDNLALDFPELRILCAHGGWPYAQEMIWIALMRKNVYLMPDLYMYNTPGMADYAAAANTVIKDKIIYGSAYPIVSQKESVEKVMNSGIKAEYLPNVFYHNALKFLGKEN